MEGGYPGVPCVSYSEHRDIDPVWKETDEGDNDCPFHVLGKEIVDLHQCLSYFSVETSASHQSYGPRSPVLVRDL